MPFALFGVGTLAFSWCFTFVSSPPEGTFFIRLSDLIAVKRPEVDDQVVMADPLSISSGIAGLISLAGVVIGQCYRYGCAVSGAPEEARRLIAEITGLSGILIGVQSLTAENEKSPFPWETTVIECRQLLEGLSVRLQKYGPDPAKSSSKRIISRLMWPLRRDETADILSAIERHKNSLSLGLDSLSV